MTTDLDDLENQSLQIHNEGESNFEGTYGGQRWVLGPSMSTVIRQEAAILWFGDPRLIDHERGGRLIPARSQEVERIKLRYGITGFPVDPGSGRTMPTWDDLPKIRVSTHAGEDIKMVIHDPAGDSVVVVNQTVEENRILNEQMEAMRRQLAALEERYANTPQRDEGVEEVPEDTPAASRRGRAS